MQREGTGVPLRQALQETLLAVVDPTILIIDFAGVHDLSGAVAEEVGPRLLGIVQQHRQIYPETYLLYDQLSPEAYKEMDVWFARYGQCVPAVAQEGSLSARRLIGTLPPDYLLEILTYCYAQGLVSSADVEKKFSAASKKLNDIQTHYPWLLHRHSRVRGNSPRAWRYSFLPIIPLDRAPSTN